MTKAFVVGRSLVAAALVSGCSGSGYDPCVHGFYPNSIGQAIIAAAMEAAMCSGPGASGQPAKTAPTSDTPQSTTPAE